jgi:Mrp family chromosome partitioning ATPase
LPSDPLRTDGSEWLASSQFAHLLGSVREQFDVVLIDTEPLLAVSDPRVIASQVDGVLLVLKPTNDSRWRAERAKEMLDAIDVHPIGVVVNGVGGPTSRTYRDEWKAFDQVLEGAVNKTSKQVAR